MSALSSEMVLGRNAIQDCIECGVCERVQDEGCGCPAGMWGPFAKRLVEQADSGAIDKDVERILFTCALCGACTTRCPVQIDGAHVVREGRAVFHALNPDAADIWRPMQTDLSGNVFTGLRTWRDITYCDALTDDTHPCESLFFPGCTLTTYAPNLTNTVFDFLRERGQASGMTVLCCGNSLWGIGLAQRRNDFTASVNKRFAKHGVQRIIAGCPNCYAALSHAKTIGLVGNDIEVCALPQVLADEGVSLPQERTVASGAQFFAVHDSCPDRKTNVFGSAIRAMIPHNSLREMEHAGRDTFCCGSGGMVSYYDTSVAKQRRANRVHEFAACGADCLVTGCISCVYSFLRSDSSIEVRHYLELVFDTAIDWSAHHRAVVGFANEGGYDFAADNDNTLILD